jgi:hypothetical protein
MFSQTRLVTLVERAPFLSAMPAASVAAFHVHAEKNPD